MEKDRHNFRILQRIWSIFGEEGSQINKIEFLGVEDPCSRTRVKEENDGTYKRKDYRKKKKQRIFNKFTKIIEHWMIF